MTKFSLAEHGITKPTVQRNLSVARLYEEAIRHDPGASIAHNGALVAYSGEKTGRSPKDKRIVCNSPSAENIWWGAVNIPLEEHSFLINRQRAIDYLDTRDRLVLLRRLRRLGSQVSA